MTFFNLIYTFIAPNYLKQIFFLEIRPSTYDTSICTEGLIFFKNVCFILFWAMDE